MSNSAATSRCIRCNSDRTKKLGHNRYGQQRHKCHSCAAVFYTGPKIHNVKRDRKPRALCYRCGGTDTIRISGSRSYRGRPHGSPVSYCRDCRQSFSIGGRRELERYHLLLRQRVNALHLPPDVAEIIFSTASEAVLDGQGYCWNVTLDTASAWREARGEFQQLGSDHPVFQFQ